MAKISRLNDQTVMNGRIMRGAKTVFVNGRPVGLHTSPITPHYKEHYTSRTVKGVDTVYAENCKVLKVGTPTSCGHRVITGSSNVNVP